MGAITNRRSGQYWVSLIGAESTGKTTLAQSLGAKLQAHIVPEFARSFLVSKSGKFDESDLVAISDGIAKQIEELPQNARLVVFDTDLVQTAAWYRLAFGRRSSDIEDRALRFRADLYFLFEPDVPWLQDGQRNRGSDRQAFNELCVDVLGQFGSDHVSVRGTWAERFRLVEGLLKTIV